MVQAETVTNTFTLDLVTPERVVESRAADMVVIPGKEGDFAVLAGHAPMISSLRAGVVRVYEGDVVKERILVASGFVEVTPDRCTLLATEAHRFDETLKGKVEARVELAKKIHERAKEEAEQAKALVELNDAQSIFDAFILENDSK